MCLFHDSTVINWAGWGWLSWFCWLGWLIYLAGIVFGKEGKERGYYSRGQDRDEENTRARRVLMV